MRRISMLNKLNLVRGLPNLKYSSDALCETFQKVKFYKSTFKAKKIVSTTRPLELLHIYMFGPIKATSVNGNKYGLIIVDDYNRWTWFKFLRHEDESYYMFITFSS